MPTSGRFIDRFTTERHVRLWAVLGGIATTIAFLAGFIGWMVSGSGETGGAPSSTAVAPASSFEQETSANSTTVNSSTIDAPESHSSLPASNTLAPEKKFIADLDSADVTSGNSYETGSVEMAGKTYSRSALPSCYYNQISTEINLAKNWTSFAAMVGIKDQYPSDYSATVTVYRDGSLWKGPLAVRVGSPTPVKIDVTGVLKLKFVCSPGKGHQGFIRLALGDALVSTAP